MSDDQLGTMQQQVMKQLGDGKASDDKGTDDKQAEAQSQRSSPLASQHHSRNRAP